LDAEIMQAPASTSAWFDPSPPFEASASTLPAAVLAQPKEEPKERPKERKVHANRIASRPREGRSPGRESVVMASR
jgi:hypothetical protein